MANLVIKGGTSQQIIDGSQDTLTILAVNNGTGLVHVGDPLPAGFDVPFRGGDQIILPANEPATLRADGFIVEATTGQYGGQTYEGGGGLLPTQAIVENGTSIVMNPAPGNVASLGPVNVNVLDNVASFWLAANRVALTTGATAPVQNIAGAAIATGTILIAANAITNIRLPATVAGVSNGGAVSVRNSAGADAHPATAVITSGALTGVNLAATSAIVDNGDIVTATGGQTIDIAVAAGVPSFTVRSFPFWQPFTVTVGQIDTSVWGYANYEGEPTIGSITNEPVSGYTLRECVINGGGTISIRIDGPDPLLGQLSGALVGVNAEDFSISEGNAESRYEDGAWVTTTSGVEGVPAWTVGQQVPIVIIPQNG